MNADDIQRVLRESEWRTSADKPVIVLTLAQAELIANELGRRDRLLGSLVTFVRDDLCDLGEAVGPEHWIEQQRLALVAKCEKERLR